jgi:hypothetical protein
MADIERAKPIRTVVLVLVGFLLTVACVIAGIVGLVATFLN